MTLDEDLQAIRRKLESTDDGQGDTSFDARERRVLANALDDSQSRRAAGAGLNDTGGGKPGVQRELDFFLVCLGWSLAVFALLVSVNWSGEHPLGGAGVFGVAFVVGLAAAALRASYVGYWRPESLRLVQGIAALALIIAVLVLIVAGAIGGALGMAVGAVVFHALVRNQQARREQAMSAEQA